MKDDLMLTFEEKDLSIQDPEILIENTKMNFLFTINALNCDIDRKFGINLDAIDPDIQEDTWIDFYVDYNPTNHLNVECYLHINTIDGIYEKQYVPSLEECILFANLCEQHCQDTENMSGLELIMLMA